MIKINNYYSKTNFEPAVLNKLIKDLKEGDLILNYKVAEITIINELEDKPDNIKKMFMESDYLMNNSRKYLIHLNNLATGEMTFNDVILRGNDSVAKLLNLNVEQGNWF